MGTVCCIKPGNITSDVQEQNILESSNKDLSVEKNVRPRQHQVNYDSLFLNKSLGLTSFNPNVKVFKLSLFRQPQRNVDHINTILNLATV